MLLAGLIGMSHFCDQSLADIRELQMFMFLVCGATYLKLSAKSNVMASRAFGRSFTKRRNESGAIMEPCGTPLQNEMFPENSPPISVCFNPPATFPPKGFLFFILLSNVRNGHEGQ